MLASTLVIYRNFFCKLTVEIFYFRAILILPMKSMCLKSKDLRVCVVLVQVSRIMNQN